MNDRQRLVIRIALSFAISNLDAIKECFPLHSSSEFLPPIDGEECGEELVGAYKYPDHLDYNGDIIPTITEDELNDIMLELQ